MSNCAGCVCGGNCSKQPKPSPLTPGTNVYLKRYRTVGVVGSVVAAAGSVYVEGIGPVPMQELQAL